MTQNEKSKFDFPPPIFFHWMGFFLKYLHTKAQKIKTICNIQKVRFQGYKSTVLALKSNKNSLLTSFLKFWQFLAHFGQNVPNPDETGDLF